MKRCQTAEIENEALFVPCICGAQRAAMPQSYHLVLPPQLCFAGWGLVLDIAIRGQSPEEICLEMDQKWDFICQSWPLPSSKKSDPVVSSWVLAGSCEELSILSTVFKSAECFPRSFKKWSEITSSFHTGHKPAFKLQWFSVTTSCWLYLNQWTRGERLQKCDYQSPETFSSSRISYWKYVLIFHKLKWTNNKNI